MIRNLKASERRIQMALADGWAWPKNPIALMAFRWRHPFTMRVGVKHVIELRRQPRWLPWCVP